MPAPAANTNAEKWTLEATEKKLKIIENYSDEDRILYVGQALEKAGVYEEIWSYWKKKWKDNEDIMDRIKLVDQRFKNKLVVGALTGRLNAGVSKLLLKANYDVGSDQGAAPTELPVFEVGSKEHIDYLRHLDHPVTAAELYPDEYLPEGEPLYGGQTVTRCPKNGAAIRFGDGRYILI